MEPYELPLTTAAAEIEACRLSPVELVDSVLARIADVDRIVQAFTCVTEDRARAAARLAEAEIADGRYRGPLHGIPFAVKDLYDTAAVPTTASSAVRAGNVPEQDAAAVTRLVDEGMVMLGKTNTHEFAYGSFTSPTANPWGIAHIPGGSSGGSAAAVAAGMCLVALGTDTAGSIRMPASMCGVVGLKPTYGRASRHGVATLAWSLDHVGPVTRDVTDSALVLGALAGHDPRDPASVDVPVPDYTDGLDAGVAGLRVGVPTNFFNEHVSEDVDSAVRRAVNVLAQADADIVEVRVPHADLIMAVEWSIMLPEASA